MIYIFTLLLTLLFVYMYDIKGRVKDSNLSYCFLLAVAIIIAGCRYVIGGDTVRYMRFFEIYPTLRESSDFFSYLLYDPLWMILNSSIKTVCNDFTFFQFIHAIIVNVILFLFFQKQTKYKFTAVFSYFVFSYLYFNMEILREILAVLCFLYCLSFYEKKKWSVYYLIAVLAFFFHSSAIVIFFFPFFRNIKFTILRTLSLVTFGVIVFLFLSPFLEILALNPIMRSKLEIYEGMELNIVGKIAYFIQYVIIPLLMIYINDNRMKKRNPKFEMFYLIYFFITSITFVNMALGIRFMNYLTPLLLVFYTEFIYNVFSSPFFKKLRGWAFVFIVFIPLFFTFGQYFKDTSEVMKDTRYYFLWYPYTNVFEKEETEQKIIINKRERYVDDLMDASVSSLDKK